jgi:hypothetical protein
MAGSGICSRSLSGGNPLPASCGADGAEGDRGGRGEDANATPPLGSWNQRSATRGAACTAPRRRRALQGQGGWRPAASHPPHGKNLPRPPHGRPFAVSSGLGPSFFFHFGLFGKNLRF